MDRGRPVPLRTALPRNVPPRVKRPPAAVVRDPHAHGRHTGSFPGAASPPPPDRWGGIAPVLLVLLVVPSATGGQTRNEGFHSSIPWGFFLQMRIFLERELRNTLCVKDLDLTRWVFWKLSGLLLRIDNSGSEALHTSYGVRGIPGILGVSYSPPARPPNRVRPHHNSRVTTEGWKGGESLGCPPHHETGFRSAVPAARLEAVAEGNTVGASQAPGQCFPPLPLPRPFFLRWIH